MKILKDKLTENPKMPCSCGLKDATKEEIEDIKAWLEARGISYIHRELMRNGTRLPYSGTLLINLPQRGLRLCLK